MALAARLGPLADTDGRRVERDRLRLDASLGQSDAGLAIDVVLYDLSSHGFLAQTDATLPIGSGVCLELAGAGRLSARIRWRGNSTVGCEFDSVISPEVLAAAIKESRVVWPSFPTNHSTEPASAVAEELASAIAEELASAVAEELDENDGRLPIRYRAIFILGSSIVLWSIVILAIRVLWAVIG